MSQMQSGSSASQIVGKSVATTLKNIELEVSARTYRASNLLRNASLIVLRGQRSGRRYKVPHTYKRQRDKASGKMRNGVYYTASAPGEAPAVRTGAFRTSWNTHIHVEKNGVHFRAVAAIQSNLKVGKGRHLLGDILEQGTVRMAPRPYKQAVVDRALPDIKALYQKPYKPK